MNSLVSKERKKYIKNTRKNKILVILTQLFILIGFLVIWEFLANNNIIDSFITSKPSRIWQTITNLSTNNLMTHIGVTVYETIVGFALGTLLGIVIAIILWWSKFLAKVCDPYLVVLNSLPKVALRTSYNYLGRRWDLCNYCYGCCNFTNSDNFRKLKWIFENR